MTEDFLQYIWRQNLFLNENIITSDGEAVEILHSGQLNTDAGPDFTDARIRIAGTLWAGCVEIHLQSSDWERHGHHTDPAYNNVVLHVVYKHDLDVYNSRRQKIPVLELHFDERYYQNYNRLINSKLDIACRDEPDKIDELNFSLWLERLAIERLEQKSEAIMQVYAATANNWEETLYRQLARNYGFSLNALPFETLAKSLPLKILLKHRDNLLQLEAMLFGQAAMFPDSEATDTYIVELQKEYNFFRQKYDLKPVDRFLWKFLRLRPINFPTLRIAQFAALLHRNEHLFSQIIEAESVETLETVFDVRASEYWDSHYVFGKESAKRRKTFGKTAINMVLINTVVPFLFVYGKMRGIDKYCSRAVNILENLPSENNAIIAQWTKLGAQNSNAFFSQAILQLHNEYCRPKRCLHCAIGNKIVRF